MRTNDPMSILSYFMSRGVPLVIDPNVPLMRTRRFDCDGEGTITEPALFWNIFGELHVHPERYEVYFKPLLKTEYVSATALAHPHQRTLHRSH